MSPSYPSYPTNLTDEQWELLGHLIPAAKAGGRPGTVELQAVVHPPPLHPVCWLRVVDATPQLSLLENGLSLFSEWAHRPNMAGD